MTHGLEGHLHRQAEKVASEPERPELIVFSIGSKFSRPVHVTDKMRIVTGGTA